MIPFSPIDSTVCTVKNCYVIGREAFTIRNKAATMNDVASDKSCAAIDVNGDDAFRIICLYFLDMDMKYLFAVLWQCLALLQNSNTNHVL